MVENQATNGYTPAHRPRSACGIIGYSCNPYPLFVFAALGVLLLGYLPRSSGRAGTECPRWRWGRTFSRRSGEVWTSNFCRENCFSLSWCRAIDRCMRLPFVVAPRGGMAWSSGEGRDSAPDVALVAD